MTSSTSAWPVTRFSRLLGLRRPVVQGPFGSGLSSVDLTVAVAEAGAVGSFGANHLDAEGITALVGELRSRTNGVINVNLWVPLPGEADIRLDAGEVARFVAPLRPFYDALGVAVPDGPPPAAPRYDDQIAALLAAAPRVVSFVFGVPDAEVVAEAHRRGVVVLATATTVAEAVVLDQAGVDVIVASGSDAGGHRGAFLRPVEESLVGTLSLVPQVVDAVAAPVVAAGGITDARQVRAAFALGAEGVQIGSGFLATHESAVPDVHKDALTMAPGRHRTVLTSAFSGRLARGVPNRVTRALADPAVARAPYPAQSALTAPLRRAAAAAGDGEHASLWSGQSAPLGRRTRAVDYLRRLDADLAAAGR